MKTRPSCSTKYGTCNLPVCTSIGVRKMKWIQFLSFFLKYLFSKYIDIYDLSMIEPPLGVHFDRTAYIYIYMYIDMYIYIHSFFWLH